MAAIGRTGVGGRLKQQLYGTQLTREACRKGQASLSAEILSAAGAKGAHVRWHSDRFNPRCKFCVEELSRSKIQKV